MIVMSEGSRGVYSSESRDTHDEQSERGEETWGIEVLAAANYQSFEEVVDKLSSKRLVDRVELREALATWVDTDLDVASSEHDVPTEIIIEGAERAKVVAEQQYPDQI